MRIVTQEEVKGLIGHKAMMTKSYLWVEGMGNGCERFYGGICGSKFFNFGSSNELTRRFAEKILRVISSAKDRLLNPTDFALLEKMTMKEINKEISRLEKAYNRYKRIAGHEEPDGWFVPASKEDYQLYQHVHDKPYREDAVMGTFYIPDDYDDEQENTPQEVFALCLLLRRLQRC